MRAVIQRVKKASVSVDQSIIGQIEQGLLVLLGIEERDSEEDSQWLIKKITAMRLFEDLEGKMNLSLSDVQGGLLVVSQFTLHASTKKGNRPSFIRAARPDIAQKLYNQFIHSLKDIYPGPVETGSFGAYMEIALVNDGPVTIIIDSQYKE